MASMRPAMRPVEQRILVPLLAAVAWVGLLVATSVPGFVSGPPPVAPRANQLVLRAGEVVDVDVEDDDEMSEDDDEMSEDEEEEEEPQPGRLLGDMPPASKVKSVLDGEVDDKRYMKYGSKVYKVMKTSETWTDKAGLQHYRFTYRRSVDGITGEWCNNFSLPDFAYQTELPRLLKKWKAKKKHRRKKYANGARYPNGRYVYIEKDNSPFRNYFYPEYAVKADWYYEPGEKERREQRARARALMIQTRIQAELDRAEYLREIGIKPGPGTQRYQRMYRKSLTPPAAKQKALEKNYDAYAD